MVAVFRLPFSEHYLWIKNEEGLPFIAVFHSFDNSREISLCAEKFSELSPEQLKKKLSDYAIHKKYAAEKHLPTKEEYLQKVKAAQAEIQAHHLPKLVISRTILQETQELNLYETLQHLGAQFPNTLCYLLLTEEESWIGASPEILGKFDKKTHEFFTMSLAGTLPTGETWSEKETEEQKPVTDYIRNTLQHYTQQITQSETYTHPSGNIQHLRTDFTARVAPENLEGLIAALHPSPAVCGVPKDLCRRKILEIEQYHRGLYAGFIKIDMPEEVFYFVNLRCAQLYQHHVLAYAGGGITQKSSPEKEWKETELKSQAILHHLKF